jgi:hypothetical protein
MSNISGYFAPDETTVQHNPDWLKPMSRAQAAATFATHAIPADGADAFRYYSVLRYILVECQDDTFTLERLQHLVDYGTPDPSSDL